MPTSDFVHLHLHTQYSLLDGAIRIPDLIAAAKEYKMPAIAVTDHGNLFGAMEFYSQVKSNGIKPIIGCELYVAPESRFDHNAKAGKVAYYHLILLCENEKGYRNLCKLVTKAYQEGFYYKPRIDKELLEQHSEGLICLSSCLSGEVPSLLLAGDESGALKSAEWFRNLFGKERYYLELQENGMEEQRKVNKGLIDLAAKLDIDVVATNDCHYLQREDHRAHEILLCIQTGKKMEDTDRMSFSSDQFFLKSPDQMHHHFRHIPEALKNTRVIADKCNLVLEFGKIHMPRFNPGEGKSLRELFAEQAQEGFKEKTARMIEQGAMDDALYKRYHDQLDYEIRMIQDMGFSGYFLIVADFIGFAKKNKIPVGPGRGSAAGSLAAYCLGITDIDPIRYNLLFERFLNPERKSMPDIDVDFCMEGRDRVIEYVSSRYGKDNVAQIITFGRMQAKAVVRDVGRVLGFPYAVADQISKLIPEALKMTLDKALKEEPRLKEMMKRPEVADLINTARSLEGLTRHASTHAAGIVISDKPLVEHLPLYVGNNGETITQFDMTWVEKIGLVKFDFLGLKTLTVIDQALKLIESGRGTVLDLTAIPLDDQETFSMLAKGDTLGIFQLESSGMRDVLTKFKPSVFEDLIAILALYRPGPLESGMVDDFINRKHGRTSIEYPLPELEPILKETYGVIVYQEQVMSISKVLADYSLGEADLLRRAMGKKKPEEMAVQKTRFEKGATKNKIDPERAAFIFELMEKFAGYGFNKSHSAAYAMVTYQTAYLKTHFPAEFMAAQLSCEAGNTDKITMYISECANMGIEVLPPHVNESLQTFNVSDGKIRFGLSAVKNVGESAVVSILESRSEDGPFCSLYDFCRRVDLRRTNKKVIESLIKCGAMDALGPSRKSMAEQLDTIVEEASSFQKEKSNGQFNLFAGECEVAVPAADSSTHDAEEWDDLYKLQLEKELMGFYVTGHPLMNFIDIIEKYSNASSQTLAATEPQSLVRMAGMIKKIKEINTKKGDRMAFISLEDLTGITEVTVFADLYKLTRDLLQSGDPLMITGVREGDKESPKMLAHEIYPLDETPRRMSKGIRIRISALGADPRHVGQLKKIFSKHRGRVPVKVSVSIPNRSETLISLPAVECDPSEEFITEIRDVLGYPAVTLE
jgi:DNA polymerase-3 subunit alpha